MSREKVFVNGETKYLCETTSGLRNELEESSRVPGVTSA